MGKNFYQYFTYQIGAGEIKVIETDANFLYVISNSVSTNLEISIGGQSSQEIPAGLSIQLPPGENTTQLILKNPAGATTTVVLALSNGIVKNNATTIAGSISASTTSSSITTLANVTATTAGVAIAANGGRQELILYNNDSSNTVWVGASGLSAGQGTPIKPLSTVILALSEAVTLITASGTAVVSVNSLES
jgi:hypothetical protein